MDLNKYLNETAAPETQYSKEEYAAMKKAEREAVWVQVDARMSEVPVSYTHLTLPTNSRV